jgi:hypothetical protein
MPEEIRKELNDILDEFSPNQIKKFCRAMTLTLAFVRGMQDTFWEETMKKIEAGK